MLEDQEPKHKRPRIKAKYNIKYYSAYAHNRVKKKYPQYTREDICKCLSMYFELAQEDLSLGNKVNFLNKLGNLYITKEKRDATYYPDTGRIYNNMPVNLWESLQLWKKNPELRNKRFVRFVNDHSDNYVFRLHFESQKAIWKNKSVYSFKFNRTLKKKLSANIHEKKVDGYITRTKKERIEDYYNNKNQNTNE